MCPSNFDDFDDNFIEFPEDNFFDVAGGGLLGLAWTPNAPKGGESGTRGGGFSS